MSISFSRTPVYFHRIVGKFSIVVFSHFSRRSEILYSTSIQTCLRHHLVASLCRFSARSCHIKRAHKFASYVIINQNQLEVNLIISQLDIIPSTSSVTICQPQKNIFNQAKTINNRVNRDSTSRNVFVC